LVAVMSRRESKLANSFIMLTVRSLLPSWSGRYEQVVVEVGQREM
jgi:hypothetical protein